MRVYCLSTLAELAPYADDWDRLAAGVPFRSWTWLSHWWRNYGPGDGADRPRASLAALCVFDDTDTLVGVAPWYVDESLVRGRVLRPLGSGEVCSDYLSVLCHPGREAAILQTLAEHLTESASGRTADAPSWDLLELDGVDAEDQTIATLAACLTELGSTVHRQPGPNCWRLELPTDWENYVRSLSSNLRRDVRRLEREFLDTGRAVLYAVARQDELPRAMDIFVDLHQRRRSALGQPGCFASSRFSGFFRGVVPDLLHRGQLQLHWLELDGRPVAAECQLAGGGVLYTYQAGVEPEAMAQQPGKLIYLAILRKAVAQGYRAFDFLRGDERYKARFGGRPRPSVVYQAVPPRAAAEWRHNLWLAAGGVKRWVKKQIGSPQHEPTVY
jgi:CelD/BcsL family acetyltransferase involved in cellulose biosynthesis